MLRTPARLLGRLLVVGLLLVVVLVGGAAGRVWWVGTHDERRPSDVIVVLGASQFDGRPQAVLQSRLDHARTLYDEGVAPRIVTVGGSQPGDRFTEAAAGRTTLLDEGVPADDVVAVERGTDTLSSIAGVRELMQAEGWDTAVLVTDPWHSLRTRAMAVDAGIDAVTSPTPQGPAHDGSAAVRYIARETAGYLYYQLLGKG